jgi:hypothetical protein
MRARPFAAPAFSCVRLGAIGEASFGGLRHLMVNAVASPT